MYKGHLGQNTNKKQHAVYMGKKKGLGGKLSGRTFL